jgi:hypothetical protein
MRPWPCLVAALLAGCATVPPPDVLAEVDKVRSAPAAAQAQEHAPDAFAQAEKLRDDANAAFEAGDTAAAQILGEQAIAAYHEAVAVARAARAEGERLEAKKGADTAEARLAALEREHGEVASDIAALEKRLEILGDLELPPASGGATGAREKARGEAVASLNAQARLLCAAGELLAASLSAGSAGEKKPFARPSALAEAKKKLGELDALLAATPSAAPIDEAMRARAACLEALTLVRRGGNEQARAPGRGDALLADLARLEVGKTGRDDRGVVLTLRELFDGNALSARGKEAVAKVAAEAGKHPGFPILVVVHQAKPGDAARYKSRGEALASELRQSLGEKRVGAPELAGTHLPLVDPKGAYAERNERVDLVFITPESL